MSIPLTLTTNYNVLIYILYIVIVNNQLVDGHLSNYFGVVKYVFTILRSAIFHWNFNCKTVGNCKLSNELKINCLCKEK